MTQAQTKTSIKKNPVFRLAMIALAAVILAVFMNTTPPEGLAREGWIMLAIVIGAVILLISEAMPMAATCFLIIVTMKYTKVMKWKEIQQAACSSTVFFCMAGFGIGAALQNTNLAAIILRGLYRLSKGNSRRMISSVLWLSAIISVFVSDGAAQIVVLAIVTAVVHALGDPEPGTSRLCGGMMLAITVGAFTGGLFLPCSNSVNIAVMDLAETISGTQMTFLQWAVFGVPFGLIATLFASWLIPHYFAPEQLTSEQEKNINDLFDSIPAKLQGKDKWYLLITAVMVVLFFASNWVKVLDTATIAMGGMFIMMMPGINLLSAKDYKKNFSAMVVLTMLCIFPMASAMSSTGAGEFVVNRIFANASSWNLVTVFIMGTVAAFLVHILVPQGSANGALSAAVIGPVLVGAGLPVATAMIVVGMQAGANYLFPIEGTWQYTFGTGHFSFSDCIKCNWPLTLCTMILGCTLVPLLSMLFLSMGIIA